ncbi:MAG: extracellular solute-binding protein [Verrucomicrobia bacterium]|nr:extracellular solute-binding protein [Verrucomicrobiota bacterium]MCH8527158.1 extracellular solute-binding protein [Kiritimatiellia bacterium]
MKNARKQRNFSWLPGIALIVVCVSCDFRRSDGPRGSVPAEAEGRVIRMLLVGDPFAIAMSRSREEIEKQLGGKVELEIVGYNDGRRLTLLNARDEVSRFDLVAFDVVWLGEYHVNGILKDLSGRLSVDRGAFLDTAFSAAEMNGALYGLPIQPHPELLWVRRDLLEASGLPPPVTTEDVLALARRMHDPERQRYGVAWNAQRGQPLGQTMAHFFAAFGVPLLSEEGRPAFHSEAGLEAARFAKALVEFSPPDIYSMAWDQRTNRFASGQVAMTYGWAARAYVVEEEPYSAVRGQVIYLPAPHAFGRGPVTPLGVWAIGVPSNVQSVPRSVQALEALFHSDVQETLVRRGNATPGIRSLAEHPELREQFPVLATIAELDANGQLRIEVRPRVPEWDALCEILGTEFHDMLLGKLSVEEAMNRAYTAAVALFEHGAGSESE